MADEMGERIARLEQRTDDDHRQLERFASTSAHVAQQDVRMDGFQAALNQIREDTAAQFKQIRQDLADTASKAERNKWQNRSYIVAIATLALTFVGLLYTVLHGLPS